MVDLLPNLLCLDDEVITNKERGVAKDVIKLSSSNSGEHLQSYSQITCIAKNMGTLLLYYRSADLINSALLEMKLTSIEGLPTLKVS